MTINNDISDLVEINNHLYNYIIGLTIDDYASGDSLHFFLNSGADDINNNKNNLSKFLEQTEWKNKSTFRPLLNEWNKNIVIQNNQEAGITEFECWIVAALEAYKTALSSTLLTNTVCRDTLMDQKCYLQKFLIDLIKDRELYALIKETAMLV